MKTSIQITKDTLEKLKQLKKVFKTSTYDELINKLIDKSQNIPESMFGIDKGKLQHFKREDRIVFREE
ncbi:MAG: hypothetical protein R6U96_03370 [Promethearchaeia archaeon]